MKQIQVALEFYYHEYGSDPASTRNCCSGWTVGNQTLQFLDGVFGEYMQDHQKMLLLLVIVKDIDIIDILRVMVVVTHQKGLSMF